MCEFMGGGEYTFLEMELRMNCPSVLWLLPHGYIPDSLGTVVLKKKKIQAELYQLSQPLNRPWKV